MSGLRRVEVIDERVFCREQARAVTVDACLDCHHIRAANEHGSSPFVICGAGSRLEDEDGGQLLLSWYLKASRRPRSPWT